ncbi:MAG: DUF1592 domain-containing protein [Pirellulales bacterium]
MIDRSFDQLRGSRLGRWVTAAICGAAVCSIACCVSNLRVHAADKTDRIRVPERPAQIMRQFCYECHAGDAAEGDLKLDDLLLEARDGGSRDSWWKVLNNVRAGTMPPAASGHKLSTSDIEALNDWIKFKVFEIDRELPDPGKVTIRRLNRSEYAATIRDLMGIDFNADIAFPPDDTGFGFDNNADVLSLSPLMLEKYLAAASEIVKQAVPTETLVIPRRMWSSDDIRSSGGERARNVRMQKGLKAQCSIPIQVSGRYSLAIVLRAHGSFEFTSQRCKTTVVLDGETISEAEYGWDESKVYPLTFQRDWNSGEHVLEFIIDPIPLPESERPSDAIWSELDVQSVTVEGPADRNHWEHPRRYEDFFTRPAPPTLIEERREYARELLSRFTLRAFRRPAGEETIAKLVNLAERWSSQPGVSFEAGIAEAMIPVLASPRFLFRLEGVDQDSVAKHEKYPYIDEYALASRLSYFLWSTMPDAELFHLAGEGRLRSRLEEQIDRMLRDPRCKSMTRNFVGQWLRTRDVEKVSIDALEALGLKREYEALLDEVRKNRSRFRERPNDAQEDPEFAKRRARFRELADLRDTLNQDVKSAMRRETEMLFEHIVREDRSLVELITADYTFLNEDLAKLYGIEGVQGKEMRLVRLPEGGPRGGILTQGTLLTVTSNPTRTSPVKRGLYILENVLGTPTPPAPPNVPPLEEAGNRFGGRTPSLRELLAVHSESALCASCHSRMDPLGLALENFNALGIWRTEEGGQAVDPSGRLITGEAFSDVRELKQAIAGSRRGDFYRCLTQKLMTYALGRGLDYYDEATVDDIVWDLKDNDGRFRDLVKAIVRSSAFQRLRSNDQATSGTKPTSTETK